MVNHYAIDFIKISLIAFFGWLGLQIDFIPLAIYAILWMLESFSQLLKNIIVYRRLNFWEWILRSIRHLAILIIPLVIVLLVKLLGQDSESLYKSSIFMITFYISLTTIGNVITMFSQKEYRFESIIIKWFESKRKLKL